MNWRASRERRRGSIVVRRLTATDVPYRRVVVTGHCIVPPHDICVDTCEISDEHLAEEDRYRCTVGQHGDPLSLEIGQ